LQYAGVGRVQLLREQSIGNGPSGAKQASPVGAHVRGFTLIELMIVIAIVGILAGIAYPSYMDHVRKGNRAKAQTFLMDVAQRQQSYLIVHRQYATSLTQLGFGDGNGVLALGPELTALSSAYDIANSNMGAVAGPPPSFNMTLNPKSGSMQVSDGSLCLSNTGARSRHCEAAEETTW